MAEAFSITISVQIMGRGSVLRVEERIETDGSVRELAGIFHQVHELAERIRDEQAGLKK